LLQYFRGFAFKLISDIFQGHADIYGLIARVFVKSINAIGKLTHGNAAIVIINDIRTLQTRRDVFEGSTLFFPFQTLKDRRSERLVIALENPCTNPSL
jgi:hypothetical protein